MQKFERFEVSSRGCTVANGCPFDCHIFNAVLTHYVYLIIFSRSDASMRAWSFIFGIVWSQTWTNRQRNYTLHLVFCHAVIAGLQLAYSRLKASN